MPVKAHARHNFKRLTQGFAPFVRAVRSCQGLENIGDRHHSCRQAHLVTVQAFGVTLAIHPFMVPTGNLGNVAQIAGEGQAAEHEDGLHNVIVDDVALFSGQCAPGDAQVVKLAAIELVLRHLQLEPPWVVAGNQF